MKRYIKEKAQKVLGFTGKTVYAASVFGVTLIGVVYAASITSTTQTVNSGDAITANWYQDVNNKLALISGKANSSDVYTKTDLYTKTEIDSLIASLQSQIPDWTAQDSNCSLPDVTIGSQTWAGCNSTLGIGIDYTPGHCYNYAGTNNGSNCGGYSSKESDYNSVGVDNIWGKLYTWDNAQNACGTGYHLPSIEEWTTLFANRGCTDNIDTNNVTASYWGWKCSGLGWKDNSTKNITNNLVKALKIPLSGYKSNGSFFERGYSSNLISSMSGDGVNVVTTYFKGVGVDFNNNGVIHGFAPKSNYTSLRCIKD